MLLGTRTLLVTKGLATRSKDALLLGARKLLGTKGIATGSKDTTSSSWQYY